MNEYGRFTYKILEDFSLKGNTKMVFIALCRYADNETRKCYPSIETISKMAGLSKSTVNRSLNILKDKGHIKIEHRYTEKGFTTNVYTLLDNLSTKEEIYTENVPVSNRKGNSVKGFFRRIEKKALN